MEHGGWMLRCSLGEREGERPSRKSKIRPRFVYLYQLLMCKSMSRTVVSFVKLAKPAQCELRWLGFANGATRGTSLARFRDSTGTRLGVTGYRNHFVVCFSFIVCFFARCDVSLVLCALHEVVRCT